MPAIVAWLLGALESRIGSIVISALLSLGISFASYKFSVAPLRAYVAQAVGGVPGHFINILGWLGVDVAITMLLSAAASKAAVGGFRMALAKKGS